MSPSAKSVVIGITSFCGPFYSDGANTGLFVIEAMHPFNVYRKQGYDVTFVSENGKYGFDDHSLAADFLSGQDKADYENADSEFQKALHATKPAADVSGKDYDIFFAAAGHGTLYDFPTASGLQRIAAEVYAHGGIVAAVCHGPVIFANLRELANGSAQGPLLAAGKSITGFTDIGEEVLGVMDKMRAEKLPTVEDIAKDVGAKYLAPIGPWDDYSITDGRLVTGVNPASAGSTATRSINALEQSQ